MGQYLDIAKQFEASYQFSKRKQWVKLADVRKCAKPVKKLVLKVPDPDISQDLDAIAQQIRNGTLTMH